MGGYIAAGFIIFYTIVLIILVVFVIVTYNNLVRLKNKVQNSFAQIDTQLQRRLDLIGSLVEVEAVKALTTQEKEIVENVTASRNGYMNAGSNGEKLAMNDQLTTNLKTLFAIADNYLELKTNINFIKLQDEILETEDKVAFSRQFYNDAVTIYNNKLQTFPNNLVGAVFGFKAEMLFMIDEKETEAPEI